MEKYYENLKNAKDIKELNHVMSAIDKQQGVSRKEYFLLLNYYFARLTVLRAAKSLANHIEEIEKYISRQ